MGERSHAALDVVILAIDIDYRQDGSAAAAGVLFDEWTSGSIVQTATRRIPQVLPYRPGKFFERELPCILEILSVLMLTPETIIIDGYVWLGSDRRPGLGAHLFQALAGAVPVVGVAKTRFADTPPECAVFRGSSARPLFVTAAGMDEEVARTLVRSMDGDNRMPAMLRAVDRLCREAA